MPPRRHRVPGNGAPHIIFAESAIRKGLSRFRVYNHFFGVARTQGFKVEAAKKIALEQIRDFDELKRLKK